MHQPEDRGDGTTTPAPAEGPPTERPDPPPTATFQGKPIPSWEDGPPRELPEVFGRYRVEGLLGRGGMGAVYKAHGTQLGRLVALKVPRLGGDLRPAAAERFLREAKAAAQLAHPNICPVFDAGEIDGVLYLSIAFIEGEPLARRVGSPWPVPPAVALVRTVALAMAESHRAGIVHRDLKPGNVIVNARGEPVVTDFGLARTTAPAVGEGRLTRDGAVLGTPEYMPPEQAGGDADAAGPASDVYSLGVVLYELLSGRVPFRGETFGKLVAMIERDPPIPPSRLRKGIPPRLEAACLKALAKRPADRFASMEQFAAALAPFLSPDRSRHRRRWVVAVAAVLALGAGAAAFATFGRGAGGARPGTPSVEGVDPAPGPGGPIVQPADRERLARLLADGLRHNRENRFDEVRSAADAALAIDPQLPTALALRGHASAAQGKWAEALADAETALRLNPECAPAYYVRALAMFEHRHDPDAAIADLTVCIRLKPDLAMPFSSRGRAYYAKGDFPQAVADCTEALKCEPRLVMALHNRGDAYVRMGDYSKALEDHTEAIRIDPTNAKWYALRSVLYMKTGDTAKAGADRQTALLLDPSVAQAQLPELPDPPKPPARKELTPGERQQLDLALSELNRAWAAGHHEQVVQAASKALAIDPTGVRALEMRAGASADLGKDADALRDATEAIRLDPSASEAYVVRSQAHNNRREFDAGIADATVASRLDPSSPFGWNNRAIAYHEKGCYGQAVADLTEAIKRRPGVAILFPNRAWVYVALGEYRAALADYSEAVRLDPANAAWYVWRSVLHAKLGDLTQAKADRDQAVKLDPSLADRPAPVLPTPLPPPKLDPELPPDQP